MRIILVGMNAKYIHSNPAIYSLAAYAKAHLGEKEKQECELVLAEYTINQQKEEIIADLYRKKPDILAFSCYIWNWSLVQEIFVTLHKLYPKLPIWLGGPEVSYTPKKILEEYPFLAGIMIGEGEVTFTELCRCMLLRGNPSTIAGVVTAEGEGKQRPLTPLDEIPFFYEDMENFAYRIIYYESSRGCPYRCSYCLSSIDKTFRLRRPELVKKELQFFLEHRVPQVKFIDRTFNANREHAMAIWQYLKENDNGVTNFHFEVAADSLSKEEIELLSSLRPGFVQLEIGVQSTNTVTLLEINRPMKTEAVCRAVEALQKNHNVHLHLDLIAGLPGEDYESFGVSFNQVYAMKPHQLQLGFLKVLKGSPLWEKADEYGIIYQDKPPYEVLFTRWMPYEKLLKLKEIEEVLEIYYNSGQFAYTVAMLEQEFASFFAFYEELASFMSQKKRLGSSPARSYRYQLLLNFIRKKVPQKEEMFVELLTFDLYLREKMKTRPEFCGSLENIREESRQLYRKEEEQRSLLPEYVDYNSRQLAKMTHLEPFIWSVWEKGGCCRMEEKALVLFDYQKRDPLTADARVQIIRGW
ncbi:MAG: B12-binding domain-containing radical SAM protein [Lachnospiraceae bacterium]